MWPIDKGDDLIGTFGPGDSLRVYRLQRRGISLDLQRVVLQSPSPLWEAWLAYLTQQAMGQPTLVLYDPHDGEAFVQFRFRARQAAADVVYLAPTLESGRRTARAWTHLLDGACAEAAGQGIQRVFASLPESGPEMDVFQQAGFSLYAGEDVYCLPSVTATSHAGPQAQMRPLVPEDWTALQKLIVAVTPQRVRQAEGGIHLATDVGKNCQWYVLPGGSNTELAGALRVCKGPAAHWLRLLVNPDARDAVDALVQWGLASLAGGTARPVYCSVRRYEGGIRGALTAAGFELAESRALVVKQTAAWVKAPSPDLVRSLATGVEPVPPAYRINSEPEFGTSNGRFAAEHES